MVDQPMFKPRADIAEIGDKPYASLCICKAFGKVLVKEKLPTQYSLMNLASYWAR